MREPARRRRRGVSRRPGRRPGPPPSAAALPAEERAEPLGIGVTLDRWLPSGGERTACFKVRLDFLAQHLHVGRFTTVEAARLAYDQAVLLVHGAKARTNYPREFVTSQPRNHEVEGKAATFLAKLREPASPASKRRLAAARAAVAALAAAPALDDSVGKLDADEGGEEEQEQEDGGAEPAWWCADAGNGGSLAVAASGGPPGWLGAGGGDANPTGLDWAGAPSSSRSLGSERSSSGELAAQLVAQTCSDEEQQPLVEALGGTEPGGGHTAGSGTASGGRAAPGGCPPAASGGRQASVARGDGGGLALHALLPAAWLAGAAGPEAGGGSAAACARHGAPAAAACGDGCLLPTPAAGCAAAGRSAQLAASQPGAQLLLAPPGVPTSFAAPGGCVAPRDAPPRATTCSDAAQAVEHSLEALMDLQVCLVMAESTADPRCPATVAVHWLKEEQEQAAARSARGVPAPVTRFLERAVLQLVLCDAAGGGGGAAPAALAFAAPGSGALCAAVASLASPLAHLGGRLLSASPAAEAAAVARDWLAQLRQQAPASAALAGDELPAAIVALCA